MATPVFCCGFECGQLGSVGQHWTSGTGCSIVTSPVRTGARSLRQTSTASAPGLIVPNVTISGNHGVARFYVYFKDALPTSNCILFQFNSNYQVYFVATDNKIYTRAAAGGDGATGFEVTINTWYLVDLYVNTSTNPRTVDAKVNGTALGQASNAIASSALTTAKLGSDGSNTQDVYFDDVVISLTAADYPLGAGHVDHFVPTSDGSHNVAGSADFRRTLTATDILNSTTDAYQLIDDVPLESGSSVDWINMVAPPNATDYVECVFGPAPGISTPTAGPRAVEVIAGIHQAGTGTGNMEIRVVDNATVDNMYTAAVVAGVTSVAYKRKHYGTAPSGGAWNANSSGNAAFNNLKMRFGSPSAGVDANPDQYLDCIMVEAEFEEVVVPPGGLTPRMMLMGVG